MSAIRRTTAATLLCLGLAAASPALAEEHRLVIQVTNNDADTFNLVLSNAANVSRDYSDRGEEVLIEILAYGPGLHMFRTDTSPVAERIQSFVEGMPNVTLTACGNTITTMEMQENRPIKLFEGIGVVKTGVSHLLRRQEEGWSYVRP